MPDENTVVIVGDGPTGLSAALLLAKNGFQVDVVGADTTPVHKALLHNVLADDGLPGPEWLERARGHAERFGARLHKARAQRIELGESLRVLTDEGAFEGRYLVLATGFDKGPAHALGLEAGPDGIRVDRNGRTSRDRVYAGGTLTRGAKTQVATGMGDGAAIALDIMSRAAGKPVHDFDVLKPKAEAPGAR